MMEIFEDILLSNDIICLYNKLIKNDTLLYTTAFIPSVTFVPIGRLKENMLDNPHTLDATLSLNTTGFAGRIIDYPLIFKGK